MSDAKPQHVLILSGKASSIPHYRGPFIKAMLAKGHRVTAVASDYDPKAAATLAQWGVDFQTVYLSRTGTNPFADLVSIGALVQMFRRIRPDLFFAYHVKPVTYGLLAARIAGVPHRYVMITGLGYAFGEGRELKRAIVHKLQLGTYWASLRFADKVIFQNPDDRKLFLDNNLLRGPEQAERVYGSGVDLAQFSPVPLPDGPVTFLLIARLLADKGIFEYVEAARRIRQSHPQTRFLIVGPLDPNPTAIKREEVEGWVREGVIEYGGEVSDVRPAISGSHVFVLPSTYREGTPRAALEAMAMGRPVITTDVPGCREVVIPGVNGFLLPPRNVPELVKAMEAFVTGQASISGMGVESRKIAVEKYDANAVAADLVRFCQLG